MASRAPGPRLRGRHHECASLDRLVEDVRAGQSRALVLRGEAGVGKTALLEYLQRRASGCRIVRAAGIESEMELPFAGLHQLCAPMLHRLGRLPGPQGDALGAAFGLREGDAPDRFLVGLAVLSLLSDVAEEHPLICVVDDAQWLDRASAQALAFVTRRLVAESVAVVFAVRESGNEQDLTGLPELHIRGLADPDARALLESVITGPIDERVRDRIVAETRGNPLALLELPHGLTPGQLAGGFGLPDAPAAVGADRGELPPAARGAAGRHPHVVAGRGGRAGRRPGAAVAGGRAARHRHPGRGPGGRGRPAGAGRPGAVSASPGAVGGLPIGIAPGAAGGASRPGRGRPILGA